MSIFVSVKTTYQKHERLADVSIFVGGFVFDILTLSNPDDLLSILQQCLYLLIIGGLLITESLSENGQFKPPAWLEKAWEFRNFLLHFILGSLLSVYSLFYIKSSSIFSSFVFLVIMVLLLVGNETKYIQQRNSGFKFSLYTLCVFSFFSIIGPSILGFVGWLPFLITFICTCIVLWLYLKVVLRFTKNSQFLKEKVLVPGGVTLASIVMFSVLGLIPPVPLSLKYAGIFHGVERVEGGYSLKSEKPWWKFWQEGDQDFLAFQGDSVFVFLEIFAPSRFQDTLFVRWEFDDSKLGWQTRDRIPISIKGGRESGYRGFAEKKNYEEGDWRVKVETSDGREVGRISFNIVQSKETNPDRKFTFQIR